MRKIIYECVKFGELARLVKINSSQLEIHYEGKVLATFSLELLNDLTYEDMINIGVSSYLEGKSCSIASQER